MFFITHTVWPWFLQDVGQNTRTDMYGTQHNHWSYICSFWKTLFLWVWSDAVLILTNIGPRDCHYLFILTSILLFILYVYIHLSYTSTQITQGPSSCHSPTSIYLTNPHSFNWCIIVLHRMIQTNWHIIVPRAWPTRLVVRKIKSHNGTNVDDNSSRTTLYQSVYRHAQIYIHYTAFVLYINVDI